MLEKFKSGHWPIFFLSTFSSIANMFLPIILVRLLTPNDIGIYKIYFLHLSIIPFLFMTGGPIHSVYYWVGKPKANRDKYLQSSWMLSTLLSVLVIIIGLAFSGVMPNFLNLSVKYYILLIVTGFLWCPGGHFVDTSIARGKYVSGPVYDTLFELAKSLGFIYIAYKYKDLTILFYYYLGLLSVKFILTMILGLRNGTISLKIHNKEIKEVFKYCLPISISSGLGFFVDKIDLFILSSELSPSDFAFYSMGCLIVPPLIILDSSVQKVMIPKLSKAYQENRNNDAVEDFKKGINDISALIIPAVAGLIFFAQPIINLLYTEKYQDSVIFLQIFAISYITYMIPHDAVARATGKTKWILKVYLYVTPISLISVYFCAKNYGAQSALIMAIIIKFIPKILGLIFSKNIMGWNYSQMFPYRKIASYTGISVFLGLASLAAKSLFDSSLVWFIVCGGLFGIIYLALVYGQTFWKRK